MDKDVCVDIADEVGVGVEEVGFGDGGDLVLGQNRDDFVAREPGVFKFRHFSP